MPAPPCCCGTALLLATNAYTGGNLAELTEGCFGLRCSVETKRFFFFKSTVQAERQIAVPSPLHELMVLAWSGHVQHEATA